MKEQKLNQIHFTGNARPPDAAPDRGEQHHRPNVRGGLFADAPLLHRHVAVGGAPAAAVVRAARVARQGDARRLALGQQPLHRLRDGPHHDGVPGGVRGAFGARENAGSAAAAEHCVRR